MQMLSNYMIASPKVRLYTLINKFIVHLVIVINAGLWATFVCAENVQGLSQPTQFQKAIEYLHQYPLESLELNAVPFCYHYTCRVIESIQIPAEAWAQATQVLAVPAKSAPLERALLAEAISRIEVLVGRITATQYDVGGTFKVDAKPRVDSAQLDCVDEAFNMHMYLHLLNKDGKLHWHRIGDLVHRGWLLDLDYPHTALAIVQNDTNERFVIDSWFHDNGRPPEVVSLQQWKAGWTPANF